MFRTLEDGRYEYRGPGYCVICDSETEFVAINEKEIDRYWHPFWFRGHLRCVKCSCVPRERMLFTVLKTLFPGWQNLTIHEAAPGPWGVSKLIRERCPRYRESQYDPSLGFGKLHPSGAYQSEDLEAQTFNSEIFDIVITQDVFEHLYHPDLAIREIARTLKPGGAAIMAIPLNAHSGPSRRRAEMVDGATHHLEDPQYHGNPMSAEGSLVTMDWGWDTGEYLAQKSGLSTTVYHFDDISRGMVDAFCEIFVCRKSDHSTTRTL